MKALAKKMDKDGYVILRAFLEPAVVESARAAASELVEGIARDLVRAGTVPHAFPEAPFETRMIRLFEKNMDSAPYQFRENLHLPGMFPLFFHPRLLDVVESFLGPEVRLYPNYTVRPKLPEYKKTEVLWHQDGAYTKSYTNEAPIASMQMVNVWSPFVRATVENGCMEFIPGTHKLGVVEHIDREYYLEIVEEEMAPRRSQAIPIELDPGDVVLFSNLLFHRGRPNHAQTIRWSADWRYQDATQPTHRPHNGHLARSVAHPDQVVRTAQDWAQRKFV
jgi:phytanoyl-CoA hydroxylase